MYESSGLPGLMYAECCIRTIPKGTYNKFSQHFLKTVVIRGEKSLQANAANTNMTPCDNNLWKFERQHIQKQFTYTGYTVLAVSESDFQAVFNVFTMYEACLTVVVYHFQHLL